MIDPKRIWSSSQLPSLPSVAVKLLELTKDPETEIRDVIETIKADPAISAKIVKAANSTYFGLKSEVRAIDRAVPLLGTTVSTSLALSFSLTDDSLTKGPIADYYRNYWQQSIVQASVAELLGSRFDRASAPEFFLAGLLQDIGRLAMLKTISREYLPVLNAVANGDGGLVELEQQHLGIDHAEIGCKLLQNWKLPEGMIDAMRLQHAPLPALAERATAPDGRFSVILAVASAAGDYFCTPGKGAALERMQTLTRQLGFTEGQLEAFLGECDARIDQAGEVMNVDMSAVEDSASLMVQANEQLVQLTLREHVASTQATMRQRAVEQEKQELETRNQQLQQQALHDPLTKVYNRHFFDATLENEANKAQRTASPIGVIFADVDHFKKLNDSYGHQFGDLVLQQVAKLFQASLRSSDILARYGGEEFVVLVNQPTEKGIEKLAERVRQRIADEQFLFGSTPVKVTCSFGAAVGIPGRKDKNVGKALVAAADECLYEAKRNGRNQTKIRSLVDEVDRQLMQLVTAHRFSRWIVAQQLLDIPTVSRALLECPAANVRIGELAIQLGYMNAEQVQMILREQDTTGERFGTAAIRHRWLSPTQLVHLLTLQQENPKQVAAAIIRLGLLPPQRAAQALEQYIATQVPAPNFPPLAAAAP